jgi:Carboxypeptidase regulatory-like domain
MRRSALLSLFLFVALLHFLCVVPAFPQGETTSAIVGQVTDATNAAIPGALITITNRESGLQRAVRTDTEGRFNFPQLKPGTYSVKVEAEGFDPQQNDNVLSGLGQSQTANFMLKVSDSKQTVEVSGESLLINPGNANTSTNLSAAALENLPNPGGDLTYPL